MINQITASGRIIAARVKHSEFACCVLDLLRRSGQPDQSRMEVCDKLANDFRGITLWINRDEYWGDLRSQLGRCLFKLCQTLRETLDVRRANVWAIGEAEIDDPILAGKVGPVDGCTI